MKRAGIGSHTLPNRGATNDWITPPHIIEALGGRLGLRRRKAPCH